MPGIIICAWGWDICTITDSDPLDSLRVRNFSYPVGLMKALAAFIAVILFFAIGVAAQIADGGPEPPRYDRGIIANGTYTNDCLGFSLAIPDGWEIGNYPTKAPGIAMHVPGGGLALLTLHRREVPTGESLTLIARDTSANPAVTPEQVVTLSAEKLINLDPQRREVTRAAYPVDYGGKHFSRLDYKQTLSDGSARYQGYVYTKFRGYLIGGQPVAKSPEELNDAVNVMQKITFRNDHPNPACVAGTDDGLLPGVTGGIISSVGTAKPGQRIRVSSAVSNGLLVQKVEPEYPEAARKARIEGNVVLDASIDETGNVENLTLISGDRALAPAAVAAVKQWKYKPYLLNGIPMKIDTQIIVDFKLPAN